jgi:hypothetical protein
MGGMMLYAQAGMEAKMSREAEERGQPAPEPMLGVF